MTGSAWLAFTPRDTVFVRDGRSFVAATDAVAATVRPSPTTIAGALGAAFGENPVAVRGPLLARKDQDRWKPYFPVPADLVQTADGSERPRVFRLRPEVTGQTDLDDESLRFLAPPPGVEPVKEISGWIPADVLADYLAGRLADGAPKDELRIEQPLVPERRVGLARENRTAREGFLYQATHLRPQDGWGFLAQYDIADGWNAEASPHVAFGGRGRLADIEAADVDWPNATATCGSKVLVYLATLAAWASGWQPPLPQGATLVAAATGEPEPAATAKREQDKWRASRVLRWTVPAGSVYLLDFGEDAAAGAAWARERNGLALDRGVPDNPDMVRTAGFGVVLTGAWT